MTSPLSSQLEKLRRLTLTLLDPQRPVYSLRAEVLEIKAILEGSAKALPFTGDISDGETRTANGVAISPAMAAMCIDDFARTVQFIRGTHTAITDLQKQISGRPVCILYAGCGPYAPSAISLMSIFTPEEAAFTLLDIHSDSIETVRSIVSSLNVKDRLASLETIDVAEYKIDPITRPDIILLEMMRAGLESEPQVAIATHLRKQAPGAVMIPAEVRIDLILVNHSREFDPEGLVERDRISLGPVFTLNEDAMEIWNSNPMSTSVIKIPGFDQGRYEPMLFTFIRVYRDHTLQDYDSGLTCPKTLSIDGGVKPGDTIAFSYETGSSPGLRGYACLNIMS